jgi:hypothetical protein
MPLDTAVKPRYDIAKHLSSCDLIIYCHPVYILPSRVYTVIPWLDHGIQEYTIAPQILKRDKHSF